MHVCVCSLVPRLLPVLVCNIEEVGGAWMRLHAHMYSYSYIYID